jgi:lipopolysaccharide biosynthesis glycosyltransferase
VLYLDADMLVKKDISYLFKDIDMSANFIGVVRELQTFLFWKQDRSFLKEIYPHGMRQYFREELKIDKPENYFNAGLILWNLSLLRKEIKNISQDLMEIALNKKFWLLDQDVLNSYFKEDEIYLLPLTWNFVAAHKEKDKAFWRELPLIESKLYFEAEKDPSLIHYASSDKPWYLPRSGDRAIEYWKIAEKTPFYLIMIEQLIDRKISLAENARKISFKSLIKKIMVKIFPFDSFLGKLLRRIWNGISIARR